MYESFPSRSVAEQYQLSPVLDVMRTWLMDEGQKTGGDAARRMPDGTAVYDADNDKLLIHNIETYEITVQGKQLEKLDSEVRRILDIGDKVDFSYIPAHYIESRNAGTHEAHPERFEAYIAQNPDSPYKDISFAVTYHDADRSELLGNRYAVLRESTPALEAMSPDEFLAQIEDSSQQRPKRLTKISADDCQALIDIANTLSQRQHTL